MRMTIGGGGSPFGVVFSHRFFYSFSSLIKLALIIVFFEMGTIAVLFLAVGVNHLGRGNNESEGPLLSPGGEEGAKSEAGKAAVRPGPGVNGEPSKSRLRFFGEEIPLKLFYLKIAYEKESEGKRGPTGENGTEGGGGKETLVPRLSFYISPNGVRSVTLGEYMEIFLFSEDEEMNWTLFSREVNWEVISDPESLFSGEDTLSFGSIVKASVSIPKHLWVSGQSWFGFLNQRWEVFLESGGKLLGRGAYAGFEDHASSPLEREEWEKIGSVDLGIRDVRVGNVEVGNVEVGNVEVGNDRGILK